MGNAEGSAGRAGAGAADEGRPGHRRQRRQSSAVGRVMRHISAGFLGNALGSGRRRGTREGGGHSMVGGWDEVQQMQQQAALIMGLRLCIGFEEQRRVDHVLAWQFQTGGPNVRQLTRLPKRETLPGVPAQRLGNNDPSSSSQQQQQQQGLTDGHATEGGPGRESEGVAPTEISTAKDKLNIRNLKKNKQERLAAEGQQDEKRRELVKSRRAHKDVDRKLKEAENKKGMLIASGHLQLVKRMWRELGLHEMRKGALFHAFKGAVQYGMVDMVKWLIGYGGLKNQGGMPQQPMTDSILRCMAFFIEHEPDGAVDFFGHTMRFQHGCDWLWLLQWLQSNVGRREWPHAQRERLLRMMALHGAVDAGSLLDVKRMCSSRALDIAEIPRSDRVDFMSELGFGGNVELFQWFIDQGLAVIEPSMLATTMAFAADKGHFALLRHLDNQYGIPLSVIPRVVTGAASGGHMEILDWIQRREQLPENCRAALTEAALGGHYQALRFLYEKCPGKVDRNTIEEIARLSPHNATRCTKFLVRHSMCNVTARAIVNAATANNVRCDLLDYLIQHADDKMWNKVMMNDRICEDFLVCEFLTAAWVRRQQVSWE